MLQSRTPVVSCVAHGISMAERLIIFQSEGRGHDHIHKVLACEPVTECYLGHHTLNQIDHLAWYFSQSGSSLAITLNLSLLKLEKLTRHDMVSEL